MHLLYIFCELHDHDNGDVSCAYILYPIGDWIAMEKFCESVIYSLSLSLMMRIPARIATFHSPSRGSGCIVRIYGLNCDRLYTSRGALSIHGLL